MFTESKSQINTLSQKLSDAFDNSVSGDKIIILDTFIQTKSENSIVIPADKSLTLDLNGKNIIEHRSKNTCYTYG